MEYVNGLPAPLKRKNGWTDSERVGQLRPDGVQRLLNHSGWEADAVRDDARDFVVERIGEHLVLAPRHHANTHHPRWSRFRRRSLRDLAGPFPPEDSP